jgi:hypothetical protein
VLVLTKQKHIFYTVPLIVEQQDTRVLMTRHLFFFLSCTLLRLFYSVRHDKARNVYSVHHDEAQYVLTYINNEIDIHHLKRHNKKM